MTREHFEPDEWEEIQHFIDKNVRPRPPGCVEFSGTIAKFDSFNAAEILCRKIVQVSGSDQGRPGTVAVPPLTPLKLRRYDPRTETTVRVGDA